MSSTPGCPSPASFCATGDAPGGRRRAMSAAMTKRVRASRRSPIASSAMPRPSSSSQMRWPRLTRSESSPGRPGDVGDGASSASSPRRKMDGVAEGELGERPFAGAQRRGHLGIDVGAAGRGLAADSEASASASPEGPCIFWLPIRSGTVGFADPHLQPRDNRRHIGTHGVPNAVPTSLLALTAAASRSRAVHLAQDLQREAVDLVAQPRLIGDGARAAAVDGGARGIEVGVGTGEARRRCRPRAP